MIDLTPLHKVGDGNKGEWQMDIKAMGAISILTNRLRNVAHADKPGLCDLFKILVYEDSQDELDAAMTAIAEILEKKILKSVQEEISKLEQSKRVSRETMSLEINV